MTEELMSGFNLGSSYGECVAGLGSTASKLKEALIDLEAMASFALGIGNDPQARKIVGSPVGNIIEMTHGDAYRFYHLADGSLSIIEARGGKVDDYKVRLEEAKKKYLQVHSELSQLYHNIFGRDTAKPAEVAK